MTLLINSATIHNIPVLTPMPGDTEHRPVVLFVHGFGGNKEAGLNLG